MLVDLSVGTTKDLLNDKTKRDIEKVLSNEFCNSDVGPQGNTCSIQNLKYRVKSGISCESLLTEGTVFFLEKL